MNRHAATIGTLLAAVLVFVAGLLATPVGLSPWSEAKPWRAPSPARASEDAADSYAGIFRGTIYYTPRESGFSKEAGFDVTPITKPGLKGRQFPRDFLKTVQIEGFGRMREAVEGQQYVKYCRGEWGFAKEAVDRRGQPLQPLRSAAVAGGSRAMSPQTVFRVAAAGLPPAFLTARWLICDTGSGLQPHQIDFYWGEDDPLGPGARLTRPRGIRERVANSTVLVLR